MNIQCHEVQDRIIESDGELFAPFVAHVNNCPACRSFLKAFDDARGAIKAPSATSSRAMELFLSTQQKHERSKRPLWVIPALSFSLSLMVLILFFGFNSGKTVTYKTAVNVDKEVNDNQYVMIQTAPVKSEEISVPENLSSYTKLAQFLREGK
ncbi:hypothetical protein KKF34_09855 [Myxococcota bacterium]|nr:hypothetical protein [Myxococcota bacterium]MBU1380336.1 hypothetical protein [Myxococcota bacterium]MBU1497169.1 hypothetical protein [Myxococcota bacterium]